MGSAAKDTPIIVVLCAAGAVLVCFIAVLSVKIAKRKKKAK